VNLLKVAKIFHLKPEQVLSSGKQPQQVKARSLLCFWAIKELEMSGTDIAQRLKVCNSVVSRSVVRGEKIAADMKLKFINH
jgi:putative transposase